MIRSYRHVRDDLIRAGYELRILRATKPMTLKICGKCAIRRETIRACQRELEAMFHPDAAAYIVQELT